MQCLQVEALLQLPQNPDVATDVGIRPLIAASLRGQVDVVRLMLDADSDVNLANIDGATALLPALFPLHVEVVRSLLMRVPTGLGQTATATLL